MRTTITATRRGKVIFRATEPRRMNAQDVRAMLDEWAVSEHDALTVNEL